MSRRRPQRRVCFVISGPPLHPGDRSGVSASWRDLARAGCDVTLAHVDDPRSPGDPEAWRRTCDGLGLRFAPIPVEAVPEPTGSRAVSRSLAVYQWLKHRQFAVVHFADRGALGYYALVGRRQGLCLSGSQVVLEVLGPTLFRHEMGDASESTTEALEQDFMERECAALADTLWSRSPFWFEWMRERRWNMPRRRLVRSTAPLEPIPPARRGRGVRGSCQRQQSLPRARPLVSVCLVHHERPRLLQQALQSLRVQTYPRFEVVLVDDGSRSDEARRYLRSLEPEFERRRWRMVRQPNRYLGAARNRAAREARGRYLLFMDDDNVAKREEIEVFVRAATASRADVLTCFLDVFRGSRRPGAGTPVVNRLTFLGGALTVGMMRNCLGDANCMIRRRAFEAIGGFTEDRGICGEDWELLAKAALSGYRVEVVPEALAWYRQSARGMLATTSERSSRQRALRPYRDALPRGLDSALILAAARSHDSATPEGGDVRFQAPESIRRIAIFGGGRSAGRAVALAERCGWQVASVVDNNPELWGSTVGGFVVSAHASLESDCVDLVMLTSHSGRRAMERQIRAMGVSSPVVFYRDPIVVGHVELRVSGA